MILSKPTQAHPTVPSQTLHALENSVQGPSVCSHFLNAYTCMKTDCLEHMLEKYGAECSREWLDIKKPKAGVRHCGAHCSSENTVQTSGPRKSP